MKKEHQIEQAQLDLNKYKLMLSLGLVFFYFLSFAQQTALTNFLYEKIGVKQGLPTSEIYTVFQDDKGYIWVGTSVGASRFDGYQFKNYFQTATKRIESINDIVQDEAGTIWLGGKNGLFYLSEDEFHSVTQINQLIVDLQFDKKGSLWVGGTGFVPFELKMDQLLALKQKKWIEIRSFTTESIWKSAMGNLSLLAMSIDPYNNIYFGNNNQLAYYTGQKLISLWGREEMARISFIHAVSPDSVFICGTELVFRQVKNGKAIPLIGDLFGGVDTEVNTIYFTGSQSSMFRHSNNHLEQIATIDEESGFGDFWKLDLLRDQEKNFWIATYDGVLLKLMPSFFTSYISKDYPQLNTNFCLAYSPNNEFLIGGHHATVLQMTQNDEFSVFTEHPRLPREGGVRAIHFTRNGTIILATELSGLLIYNQDCTYITAYSKEDGLVDNNHFFLFEDSKGILWSGSNAGVNKIALNPRDEPSFQAIPYKNREKLVLENKGRDYPVFKGITEDQYGHLWTVSTQGLYYIQGDRLFQYELPFPFAKGTNLFDIEKDKLGNLWISSLGEGVLQVRPDKNRVLKIVKVWTQQDGLISNTFLDLHIDKLNRLWMADVKGLCYLDQEELHCFTKEDGWFDIVSQHLKMIETPDSLLWTVGYTGLVSFPLYDFQINEVIPQPILQTITLFDGKEDIYQYAKSKEQSTGLPQKLILPYDKNQLRFHFSSSSQSHPSKNQFRFMLENEDEDWRPITKETNISYPNLSPNAYTFHLQASNNDGIWSEETTTYTFRIRPPWWKTTLAYGLYFLLFTGALFFARRQILQRERLKSSLKLEQIEKEKVQAIDQLRARFFANISHEFRTPLTLIKAPLEDLLMSKKDHAERITFLQMHQNTERLLHLVSQLLDLSRLEAGMLKLEVETVDVYQFLRQLGSNFDSLAQQKQIDFQISIPNTPLFLALDRDKLEKIVLNLLSNAFKFTPKNGWVKIETNYVHHLQIKVGNSGEPIPKKEQQKIFERFYQASDTRHQGDGVGLALVRELVTLQKGEVSVESTTVKGTWFSVNLPLEHVSQTTDSEIGKDHLVESIIFPLGVEEKEHFTKRELSSLVAGEKQNTKLLLIVEDHPEVRDYIASKLEHQYQIITAENGSLGFEKATEQIPDLIISDVMMPVMNGVQFCQKIKSDHRTDHIPVILLTAKADIESRLEGLQTGADDYLAKPFNSRELQARCRNLIQQRQKLKEHFQQGIHIAPSAIEVDSASTRFLKKAIAIIEQNIDNADFSVEFFAQNMQLSRIHLHRKLKAIAGMSATDFVRNLRLERAASLLQQKSDNVSQIAYQVGFENLSYFTKCFKEKYGITPSEYKK